MELFLIQIQWSSHAHWYRHVANHILTACAQNLENRDADENRKQCVTVFVLCVRVCLHLGVVIVCVWQGGECGRKRKLRRDHLSSYGHSSLWSLHHGLQFVCRDMFGVD